MKIQPTVGGDLESDIARLEEVVDKHLDFGEVYLPEDWQPLGTGVEPGTTSTASNGLPGNFRGAWVEAWFEAVDTATTFYHNLDNPVFGAANQLNVMWLTFGFLHDNNGVGTGTPDEDLSINFQSGDTYTTDSIELRLYGGGGRIIDSIHPVVVTLFFMPADGSL